MADETPQGKEHRGFSRSSVKVHATIFPEHASPIEGDARDLSLNGAFIACNTPISEGSNCRIELSLDSVHVEVMGKVVRLAGDGVAVIFSEVVGIESFEHLQRLVLYNSSDPEQVLEESKSHIGIRR